MPMLGIVSGGSAARAIRHGLLIVTLTGVLAAGVAAQPAPAPARVDPQAGSGPAAGPAIASPPSPGSAKPAIGAAPDALPRDLSPRGMVLAADVVVKAVMAVLGLASLATWTVWLSKGLELVGARRRATRGWRLLAAADDLDSAAQALGPGSGRADPVAALVAAALRERSRSAVEDAEGIKERVAIALSRIEDRAGRAVARGTGLLATVGAVAPFVGLFGTVWGIMNAFVGIAQTRTTNLAVVAPGIAEALLATAAGLVAAIPAVIIYNVFARAIAGYRMVLSDASGEVLQHLSRELGLAKASTRADARPRAAE